MSSILNILNVFGYLKTSGVQLGMKIQYWECQSENERVRVSYTNLPQYQTNFPHTIRVSHYLGITLSCSNTVTISHSFTRPPFHFSISNSSKTVWHSEYWDGFGNNINTFSHFLALKLSHSHTLTLILDPNLPCMCSP